MIILAPTAQQIYTCSLVLTDHAGNITRASITPFWFKPTCGNGSIDTAEECDEGRFCANQTICTDNLSLCPFECKTQEADNCTPWCNLSVCGDGYIDSDGGDNGA